MAVRGLTYRQAGVDIDAGDSVVDRITPLVRRTLGPQVIGSLGGYAGLFKLPAKGLREPVLVGTTDGVGTKLKLAFDTGLTQSVGIDLVAMCVNDLVCCGAKPLFFLDYFATGKLKPAVVVGVIAGMASALRKIDCALLGGETAEMPGFYDPGEFDLAGFAVGVVDRKKIIDGSRVRPGDRVIGIASSGVHSNGYSLVRAILKKRKINPARAAIGRELMTPTRIYVTPVLELLKRIDLHAVAHITGGGIVENLPRVLPERLKASLDKKKIRTPKVFRTLQKMGNVAEEEMWRVFNMGVGMIVVVAGRDEKRVLESLTQMGYPAATIGEVTRRRRNEAQVEIIPRDESDSDEFRK